MEVNFLNTRRNLDPLHLFQLLETAPNEPRLRSVVAEAAVAVELASSLLDKFGGDSVKEVKSSHKAYMQQLKKL